MKSSTTKTEQSNAMIKTHNRTNIDSLRAMNKFNLDCNLIFTPLAKAFVIIISNRNFLTKSLKFDSIHILGTPE